MLTLIELYHLLVIIVCFGVMFFAYRIFDREIFPWIVNKRTKDIEKNPKWIVPKLRSEYYGFENIDIIIVNSPLGMLPRFRLDKNKKNTLQLLISEDTSVKDIDDIAQLALVGKLKAFYGIWYPEKPTYWLSILLYMLDGGDIKIDATKWEKTNE